MVIIDSFTFPGNSGGPVYWKPSSGLSMGKGLKGPSFPARQSKLVGIVKGHLPYREEAVSKQTGRNRIIFEENSGLALVIPASKILKLLESDKMQRIIKESSRKDK